MKFCLRFLPTSIFMETLSLGDWQPIIIITIIIIIIIII